MKTRIIHTYFFLFILLAFNGMFALAQADNTRIEALDGGVVDLSGVTHIIGLGRGVDVIADGEGSRVNLSSLEVVLDDAEGLDSSLDALNQGVIELNSTQATEVGSHVNVHVRMTGTISFNTLSLTPGSLLYGQGSLPGNIINSGQISPGEADNTIGRLIIAGDYTQIETGKLFVEMEGNSPGTGFDQLNVSGAVNLAGVLAVNVFNDFIPVAGSQFEFISGATRNGEFNSASGLTLSTGGQLSVIYNESSALLRAAGIGFEDQTGPVISQLQFDTVNFSNASVLNQSGLFTTAVTDPSGVSRVEYILDGRVLGSAVNETEQYAQFWNPVTVNDGLHTLTVIAFDTLNNTSSITYSFSVALVPPVAPQITQPLNGLLTNQQQITVAGSAAAEAVQIQLYLDGVAAGELLNVQSGSFSGTLTLNEGLNQLQAKAVNRAGESVLSNSVSVELDSKKPDAPSALVATAREAGEVILSWSHVSNQNVIGFELYRASSSFNDIAGAVKLNSALLTEKSFIDLPATDGRYFYRVLAVNSAGTRSDLSNQEQALSDSGLPQADSIVYSSTGLVDNISGRMAPGLVTAVVTVNEPLLTTPFFSITPDKGVPISIALTKNTDTEYQGEFTISESTPSGTAFAVFSARDLAGNRGTDILQGSTLAIDTDGPSVTLLAVTPLDPIQNDENNPVNVTVSLTLDEAPKSAKTPNLEYILSAAGRIAETVVLTELDSLHWQASFELPADAGLNEVETLSFNYQGMDDLDNNSTDIKGNNHFQVYQGDLPPLDSPSGLSATALASGQVQLQWNAVETAADYELYRQAPGETELTALIRSNNTLQYIDDTVIDGNYQYAIASVRQINNQEAISALSASVEVKADATPPAAPQNLVLNLTAVGIESSWSAPQDGDILSYRLYRSALPEISDINGIDPVLSNITVPQAVDSSPSEQEHSYVVTAVDPAGNESLPSNSVYLNFGLLPVTTLNVELVDDDYPLISWTHSASDIAGYDLFLGEGSSPLLLNNGLLSANSYEDTGYAGEDRLYSVLAEDINGARSLSRSLLLPAVQFERMESQPVKRGIMNVLSYSVQNNSNHAIEHARLKLDVGGHAHSSAEFSLIAGGTQQIDVIVGGYQDLSDLTPLSSVLEILPNVGEQVNIERNSDIDVTNAGLVLQLLTQEMTRGGTGKVRINLENSSDVALEIVTTTNTASAPSDQVRFKLLDEDGNVLSTQAFKQSLGAQVLTLADGNTVARIEAGDRFESEWFDLVIPPSAPDNISIVLEVDQLHYHLSQPDVISVAGLQSRQSIVLVETAYSGDITAISPSHVLGTENVDISGKAIDRTTQAAVAQVPLKLIFAVNGFERSIDVITDDQGNFTYSYQPLGSESGLYRVSAIHPDLLERPEQGQFTVGRITLDPTLIDLSIPRNTEKQITFNVGTGLLTTASNLQLQYLDVDQTSGSLEPGVQVSLPDAIVLSPEQSETLTISIQADDTAVERGSIFLRLLSDESGSEPLAMVRINFAFSEAIPALFSSPSFIETGVIFDSNIVETLELENSGFAALENVSISLLDTDSNHAPSWIYLMTVADLGNLAIAEKREVSINVQPASSVVAEGLYEFKLRVESDNLAMQEIPVFVSVSQAGTGNVLFHLSDIYTATLDASGELIQGLSGASIQLQKDNDTLLYDQTQITDVAGETLFTGIPVGDYKFRAKADNHQELIGRISIKPGVTLAEEVFLDNTLVTVEWSVTEIALQDRYNVDLRATFETDVPAAVVVIEPLSINLPEMSPGEVFYGEFTITNYGLIRADEVQIDFPATDEYFAYEFLAEVPETLDAKQRITIPYRVTSLKPLTNNTDGVASGGGCFSYGPCLTIHWTFVCTNGFKTSGSFKLCFPAWTGQCSINLPPPTVVSGGRGQIRISPVRSLAISPAFCALLLGITP